MSRIECPKCGDTRHEVGATTAERVCWCRHRFTVQGDRCPVPTQEYGDSFLEHAAVTTSQYDRTCRVLAAEVIRNRREIARLRLPVARLAEAGCRECARSYEDRPNDLCQSALHWHEHVAYVESKAGAVAALLAMVRRLEWFPGGPDPDYEGQGYCGVCGGMCPALVPPGDPRSGHRPGCALAALLTGPAVIDERDAVLRAVEWMGPGARTKAENGPLKGDRCPYCHHVREIGHGTGCKLAALLTVGKVAAP